MEEVLIPIVLFMVIGATIIAAVIFRFLEKKKLLEKDLPAEDLYNLMGVDRSKKIVLACRFRNNHELL
ncbi:MAG: hypothetical protein IPG53_11400 [Ignavibacteriales bacterium]|nr:hypothetical protein [Ignavibacteriales bacterium]